MNNWQELNIDTIGDGQAKDMLNFEIGNAIKNCIDVNKDYKKARKVSLEITLVPAEDRSKIGMTFQAKSKLVPDKAGEEHVIIANGGVPYVNNAHQMSIEEAIATGEIENYNPKTGEVKQ